VVELGETGRDGIERFHGTDQLAGGEHLDLQPAARQRGAVIDCATAWLEARQALRPDGDMLSSRAPCAIAGFG